MYHILTLQRRFYDQTCKLHCGTSPAIWARYPIPIMDGNFLNLTSASGLVNMSAVLSSVATCTIRMAPRATTCLR